MKIYSMIGSLVVTLALISYSIGFFKQQKSKKIIAFRPMQRNFVLKLPEKWRII